MTTAITYRCPHMIIYEIRNVIEAKSDIDESSNNRRNKGRQEG